jgi:ribosomal protein S18 acetylase RimI-like enzyme
MPAPDELRFRAAERGDGPAIAALHADSWQRHYRGAYTDVFLDDEAAGFLLDLWTRRFADPDPRAATIVAERAGALLGLAHTVVGDYPAWGALLDNLHVAYGLKRQGVGTRLLSLSAQAVAAAEPGSGLYLWVLEQNAGARAFYGARGGTSVENGQVAAPAGDATRLNGQPRALRYAWPDAATLLAPAEPRTRL